MMRMSEVDRQFKKLILGTCMILSMAGAAPASTFTTLSWGASPGATSYGLQVSTSPSFSSFVVNLTGITTTSYTVTGLAENTTYYWRVNASNAGGTSAWTDMPSFTTLPGVPSIPALIAPASGATGIAIPATLSWYAVSGAASYGLQVSTSSVFSTFVVNLTSITATSYAVSGLNRSTTYWWRVNATNSGGTSAWATSGFTTAAPVKSTTARPTPAASPTITAFIQGSSLRYEVLGESKVGVTVFDLNGRRLFGIEEELRPAGSYEVQWPANMQRSGNFVLVFRSNAQEIIQQIVKEPFVHCRLNRGI